MGNTEYKGRNLWAKIDPMTMQPTGEVKEIDEFQKEIDPNARHGFMITYLAEIISLIDKLGNQKMKIVKYILENMDKHNNTLIITTRELSRKSGVGFSTVIETLQILDEAGIIQRRTGAIMLSPRLCNNRSGAGEASMMITYREFCGDVHNGQQEPPETPNPNIPHPNISTVGRRIA